MESLDKNCESSEEGASGEAMGPSGRRSYESPCLVEWGAISDLTHGAQFTGEKDFPVKGGTKGV
jgi:hypothetical protein